MTALYIAECRAFRTLIHYRLRSCSSSAITALAPLLRAVWRPHPTLLFYPESLGPGCFILHGDATMVTAKSIGENFVVGQHVVVGYRGADKMPTIGDDVTINVGAIVIGEITIGDGATIGPGALVASHVPNGTTVLGAPARPVPTPRRDVQGDLSA